MSQSPISFPEDFQLLGAIMERLKPLTIRLWASIHHEDTVLRV